MFPSYLRWIYPAPVKRTPSYGGMTIFQDVSHVIAMIKSLSPDQRECCADAWIRLLSDSAPGVPQSCLVMEDARCSFQLGQPKIITIPTVVEPQRYLMSTFEAGRDLVGSASTTTLALLFLCFLVTIWIMCKACNTAGHETTAVAPDGPPATITDEVGRTH